jgi:hypothetical protein
MKGKNMMVQKKASLHEKTVQKVATGEVKKERKLPTIRRPRNTKVVKTKWSDDISPLLVQWVKDNNIHWTRVQRVSYTSITIAPKKD